MFNNSETFTISLILLVAFGVMIWGFNRAKKFGKLGILAWLQSVILMGPWLLFFTLFALGIYLNLIGIILLLVTSIGAYIFIGKKLREQGQDVLLKEKAAQRIKMEEEAKNRSNSSTDQPDSSSDPMVSPRPEDIFLPIPQEDLKIIQGIFGIDTFFATETISYQEGAIFRGNLRGEPEKVHNELVEKLTNKLDDKYRLFLVESPEEKPVVIILPSSNDPKPSSTIQKVLAFILMIATAFTTLEAAGFLLGFDLTQAWNRYTETIPFAVGIFVILGVHEFGHFFFAKKYNVRLSLPYFIPNWQIASFGALNRFESLLPHRSALFDIAFAGPAIGGITSLLMLCTGLLLSHPGSQFQIPSDVLQGSILVGSLAKIFLGDAISNPVVDINPLMLIGWLGLVITALNLLPAGQLDGGRIVQAIYGRKTARRSTIATLIILGIIALFNPANPIPLYWAVVILFLQRGLERPSLNEITEPDDARAAYALLALFLMLATLIPLTPSLAGRLGIG
jgi:membrane-associated protease RseP (regulator of RpoE activity)